MANMENVANFPGSKKSAGGNGNGSSFGERLAGIEEQLRSIEKHGATKEDISKVKIWFLCGVLAAIGMAVPAAVGVAYAAARLFPG